MSTPQVGETYLSPHAQRPPAERRERRRAVAGLLLDGAPVSRVLALVSARFTVSPSAVRLDVRAVLAAWRREDTRATATRRSRVLRALERNARACRRCQDLRGEREALGILAKLLGMFPRPSALADLVRSMAAGTPMVSPTIVLGPGHEAAVERLLERAGIVPVEALADIEADATVRDGSALHERNGHGGGT